MIKKENGKGRCCCRICNQSNPDIIHCPIGGKDNVKKGLGARRLAIIVCLKNLRHRGRAGINFR